MMILLIQKNDEVYIVDWQGYGIGHPSSEFAYFLAWVEPDPAVDHRIMKVYYDELTKTISPEDYPWEVFQRETEIRTLAFSSNLTSILSMSPETHAKTRDLVKKKEGMDFDQLLKLFPSRLKRFTYVVEKWKNEDVFKSLGIEAKK